MIPQPVDQSQGEVPGAGNAATVRMSALDRPWLRSHIKIALGPLNLPSLDDLRAAFVELAATGEHSRVGYQIAPTRRHWVFDRHRLTELAEQMVTEEPDAPQLTSATDAEVFAELSSLLARQTLAESTALRFVRSGSLLLQAQNHALGDAQAMMRLPGALAQVASTGVLPKWVSEPLTAHPLWAAVRNSAAPGRSPLSWLLRERPTRGLAGTGPGAAHDWTPQVETTFRSFDRAGWDAVKRWRRESAPEASIAALYLTILRQALAEAGIRLSSETVVLYDCRRHLPARSHVRGNFVIARSQQFGADPVAVSRRLAQTVESAQPLATLVAATAKNALFPRRRTGQGVVDLDAACVPAFVFAPRNGELEAMPWSRPDLRCLATASPPSGPSDLTATVVMVGGRLSVSLTFHGNVLDAASAHQVLELMENHAARLLSKAAAG